MKEVWYESELLYDNGKKETIDLSETGLQDFRNQMKIDGFATFTDKDTVTTIDTRKITRFRFRTRKKNKE